MFIDRRTLLKSASAALSLFSLPAWASLHTSTGKHRLSGENHADLFCTLATNSAHNKATLTVVNKSAAPVQLGRIDPGLVHAEGQLFDLNEVTHNGTLHVPGKSSIKIEVNPVAGHQQDRASARKLNNRGSITVSTKLTGHETAGMITTTRSILV